MKNISLPLFMLMVVSGLAQEPAPQIARQGQVSFFSYTTVENIEAINNHVLSILDPSDHKIAVSMLMRAFVFKKALMQEHFNESYVESDSYPKATFEGTILDFDPYLEGVQTKMIEGQLTVHGITKETNIKAHIENLKGNYSIHGDFQVAIKDFEIRVPPVVEKNIAKTIAITFQFEYTPYKTQ
ncbi:MAG: YceI family protein [Bacteroidota bacterium]